MNTSHAPPLHVSGLDWNDRTAVLSAWVDLAVERDDFCDGTCGIMGTLGDELGFFAHQAMVEKIVGLMGLISEHCPQLTQSVSQIYVGRGLCESDLNTLVGIGSHEYFQAFGYGVTDT